MSSELESRLAQIEKRNQSVERDKAWETSMLRRSLITVLTYFLVLLYLYITKSDRPYLTAVVPALGYFLSTLVLTQVKAKYFDKD